MWKSVMECFVDILQRTCHLAMHSSDEPHRKARSPDREFPAQEFGVGNNPFVVLVRPRLPVLTLC